jgi:superfamily II DNA or RNA helicase
MVHGFKHKTKGTSHEQVNQPSKPPYIQVDSSVKEEETVQKLLTVEQNDNPVEIVIHVNMLKEGWDVTNLYTIIPLRAANARTLIEQSIGRGLRLPYGKRTDELHNLRLALATFALHLDAFEARLGQLGRSGGRRIPMSL